MYYKLLSIRSLITMFKTVFISSTTSTTINKDSKVNSLGLQLSVDCSFHS